MRARLIGTLALALFVAACGGGGGGRGGSEQASTPTIPKAGPIGHDEEPWADDLFRDMAGYWDGTPPHGWVRWDSVLGWRVQEGTSEYVNVVDRARQSYKVGSPTVRVWFFGGSTMFGFGQRDEHTIPSEVVRLAEKDGIRIEAVNLGTMAYVNWQEATLFAERLTNGETADLAVFYDGANENATSAQRGDLGDGDQTRVARQLVSKYEIDKAKEALLKSGKSDPVPREQAVLMAAKQYLRGVDLATRLGESYDVPTAFIWQPLLPTKLHSQNDKEILEREKVEYHPDKFVPDPVLEAIRTGGFSPIDLTRALDGADRPVYIDGAHTNEHGALLIAEAMYRELRPELVRLAG